MKRNNIYQLTMMVAFLAVLVIAGCKKSDPETANKATPTLYQAIESDEHLALYRAALKRAGLDNAEIFSQGGPLTVFAPMDSAFVNAGYTLDNISKADPETLAATLKYSILYGRISSKSLVGFYTEDTRSKDSTAKARLIKNYYGIFFDGIPLIPPLSRELNDGILHVLGRMPSPPVDNIYSIISKSPDMTMFAAVLRKANLADKYSKPPPTFPYSTPGDGTMYYTLFAPNDDAFRKAGFANVDAINNYQGPLLDHIVGDYVYPGKLLTSTFKGGYALFSDAEYVDFDGLTIISTGNLTPTRIVRPDVMATNGTIQVVNQIFTIAISQ